MSKGKQSEAKKFLNETAPADSEGKGPAEGIEPKAEQSAKAPKAKAEVKEAPKSKYSGIPSKMHKFL